MSYFRFVTAIASVLCAKGDTVVIIVYGVVENEWGVEEEEYS